MDGLCSDFLHRFLHHSIHFLAMADLVFSEHDGILTSTTDSPPIHYIVKLQSFSLLAKNNVDKYISGNFEAGGYKWKLVIYPNGNKAKNASDSLSLYLMIDKESFFHPGLEIHAVFKMFLLDQNKDNYLTFEGKARRFHKLKPEWGFDRLMPSKTFSDPSNGYLVNDGCMFGVEVYICKENNTRTKGESLMMMKDAISYKHSWKIESFSSLTDKPEESKPFHAGEQKWKIQLYPKGKGSGTGNNISLYLALADPTSLSSTSQIYVDFTLRIIDQINAKNYFGKGRVRLGPS
ncbi:OLC1v1020725C1 [Oldenlandia corymbosa var. corymbosa]|uniref:OLC1v1020725C1 n=1 Tax=Oldenlandia corymbosa var. corymbosa TaxID=529605 RepID=A0AAV1EH73_OLDCO|nr:OLC1v1020725C1 [Oldenlandia corymbosa var. corymbosa]